MNNKNNLLKDEKTQSMLFTLKILALFFCAIPVFQFVFEKETQSQPYDSTTLFNGVILLMVLLVFTLFWIFMDSRRSKYKSIIALEMCIFFSICIASVTLSGALSSDYKFIFIFMIVLYTIELGMNVGVLLSVCSSLFILGTDLFFYRENGVNAYFENDLAISATFIVVAWVLGYYVRIANSKIELLTDYANLDGLTGVFNHRYFYDTLKEYYEKSLVSGIPMSLIMLDIDYFKVYNDMYGHQQGDKALKDLSYLIQSFVGPEDVLCRYGGEEFSIILWNRDIEQAQKLANDLRELISEHPFDGQEHLPHKNFTVSMGVSQLRRDDESYASLVRRADMALYRAKYLRRNSVEVNSSIFEEFSHLEDEDAALRDTVHSLKTLLTVVNSRDSYTFSHTERVVQLCAIVADFMHLTPIEKRRLCYAAYLHDLGKINIPKEILISDHELTPEEWEELQRHPIDSAAIVSKVGGLDDVVPIVRQHHERYDGTGYPEGIAGENIDHLARILTLADSFDAMTNTRPYQMSRSYQGAFEEIRRCAGEQFDPALTEVFIGAVTAQCGEYLHHFV